MATTASKFEAAFQSLLNTGFARIRARAFDFASAAAIASATRLVSLSTELGIPRRFGGRNKGAFTYAFADRPTSVEPAGGIAAARYKIQVYLVTGQCCKRESACQTTLLSCMRVWSVASRGAAIPSEIGILLCNEWMRAVLKRVAMQDAFNVLIGYI